MPSTLPLALGVILAGLAFAWARRPPPRLRALHRASAAVVAAFAAAHLLGHLASLAGVAAHQAVLEALRTVYRQPLAEALLLSAVLFQVGSGFALLWRGRVWRRGALARVQAVSGAYLGLFLLNHVAAVFVARAQGLDTNWYFAAAGLHVPLLPWFFAPYYFLAVLALGAHVGCALYRRLPPPKGARVLAGAVLGALALAACLVGLLAGWLGDLEIPARYTTPLQAWVGRS